MFWFRILFKCNLFTIENCKMYVITAYLQRLGVCSSIFRWAIHQKFIHSDGNQQKNQKLGNRYMCHLILLLTPNNLSVFFEGGGEIYYQPFWKLHGFFTIYSTLLVIIWNFGWKVKFKIQTVRNRFVFQQNGLRATENINYRKKQWKAFFPFKQIDFDLCQEREGVTLCLHCALSAETHTHTLTLL